MNITINNKTFTLKFGYGCLKTLGELWGIEDFQGVISEFLKLAPANGNLAEFKLTFGVVDKLVDVIYASVLTYDAGSANDFDKNDCADYLLGNPEGITMVFTEFMNSMPKPDPKTVGKQKKAQQSPKR